MQSIFQSGHMSCYNWRKRRSWHRTPISVPSVEKGFKRDANLRMHMRGHGDDYKNPAALAKPVREPGTRAHLSVARGTRNTRTSSH